MDGQLDINWLFVHLSTNLPRVLPPLPLLPIRVHGDEMSLSRCALANLVLTSSRRLYLINDQVMEEVSGLMNDLTGELT